MAGTVENIKVLVRYGGNRSKVFELSNVNESNLQSRSQLSILSKLFLLKTKADKSICAIGGSLATKPEDLLFFIFNPELEEEVEFEEGDKLFRNAKLTVKLKSLNEQLLSESLEGIDTFSLLVGPEEIRAPQSISLPPTTPSPKSDNVTEVSLDPDRTNNHNTPKPTDPSVKVFLPKLSPTLEEAQIAECLKEHELDLIGELASHIQQLVPYPSKHQWNKYASLVIEHWPWLRDKNPSNHDCPWQVIKTRLERWVQNRRVTVKKKVAKTVAARNATTSIDETEAPDQVSETQQDDASFKERRNIMAANSTAIISKIVNLIPEYLQFETISKDFSKLDSIAGLSKEVFIARFQELQKKIFNFLKTDLLYSTKIFWDNLHQVDLLLEVNNLCSTSKGFKPRPPSLINAGKANDDVVLINDFIYPHSNIYFADEKLSHQIIDCGGAVHYIDNALKEEEAAMEIVFFNLLKVYYVFDINYPACYGLLSLIDRYCVSTQPFLISTSTDQRATAPRKGRKGTKTSKAARKKAKPALVLDQFLEKFSNFLALSNDQDACDECMSDVIPLFITF